jgi:metal-responsive CopG/Arc/MetJ family transcriptional regulator
MKVAISLPDEVFERSERVAKRLKVSRSELYSRALREFIDAHAPDYVTTAWNDAIAVAGQPDVQASRVLARRVLGKMEW